LESLALERWSRARRLRRRRRRHRHIFCLGAPGIQISLQLRRSFRARLERSLEHRALPGLDSKAGVALSEGLSGLIEAGVAFSEGLSGLIKAGVSFSKCLSGLTEAGVALG
jgi:hypothetical protein